MASVGQQPIAVLTADILQTFLARQESLAPATYNRRLAALRSFIRWLHDQGWEASALLDGIARKPEGKRMKRALDAQKVESVLRKIEDPRDRALFWLIYDGGLRSTSRTFPGLIARFVFIAKATVHARCSSRVDGRDAPGQVPGDTPLSDFGTALRNAP